MDSNIQTGIYWEDDSFNIVRMDPDGTDHFLNFSLARKSEGTLQKNAYLPGSLQTSTEITNFLKEKNIRRANVNISLPTKDIIFRSFIIPTMPSSEVKGAVDFEASKYIPFALEELVYSFHPIPFVKEGVRSIRIIFIAIKKTALESVTDVIDQNGLITEYIEPGSISLIRALMTKQHINEDDAVALIVIGKNSGSIVIINKFIPYFVREFKLKSDADHKKAAEEENPREEGQEPTTFISQLTSEIRISLNYFNRQESHLQTQKIILLSLVEDPNIQTVIQGEVDLPIVSLNARAVLEKEGLEDIGLLYAYGASLPVDSSKIPEDFYFSKKIVIEQKEEEILNVGPITAKPFKYKAVIATAVLSLVILGTSYFLASKKIIEPQKEIKSFESKLGDFKDVKASGIELDARSVKEKIDTIKNIQSYTNIAFILAILPDTLPKGIWLEDLDIKLVPVYDTTGKKSGHNKNFIKTPSEYKLNMSLSGYAFLQDTKAQFGLVNKLITNFENNEHFSNIFDTFSLDTLEVKSIKNYTTTFFKVRIE